MARLLREVPDTWVSVSITTRAPRAGEVDGVHYFFVEEAEFDRLARTGGLLEWARYSGNGYGTPRASVEEHIAAGDQVILEIEVQGALQVREQMPDAHLVFIEPPSLAVLEERLRGRGTEDEAAIRRRMETAEMELSCKEKYDTSLVNDDFEQALAELVSYVNEQAEGNTGLNR